MAHLRQGQATLEGHADTDHGPVTFQVKGMLVLNTDIAALGQVCRIPDTSDSVMECPITGR